MGLCHGSLPPAHGRLVVASFLLLGTAPPRVAVCLCVSWLYLDGSFSWEWATLSAWSSTAVTHTTRHVVPLTGLTEGAWEGDWSGWGQRTGAGLTPLLPVEPRTSPHGLFTSSLERVFPDARWKLQASVVSPKVSELRWESHSHHIVLVKLVTRGQTGFKGRGTGSHLSEE